MDMGVSLTTVAYLRSQRHDVVHLRDEGLQRAEDAVILAKAQTEGRIVVTFDLDFGDLLAAARHRLPSAIIFRLRDQSPAVVNGRLQIIIEQQATVLTSGAIILVEAQRYRIRRLPIGIE